MYNVHVAPVVSADEAKFAVAVVAEVSATELKVTEPAVQAAVNEAEPPSLTKLVPVMVAVPEAPAPIALVVAPCGVNDTAVTAGVVTALATVAMAKGSAAAASKAPAASDFTKWRCIRRGLFMVNSLHS
jgi:hypothetical protein